MPRPPILLTALALAGSQPALAGDAAELVARGMAERAPDGWQVRVRWRQDALVAFLTAPTPQEAFELYYDTHRQAELVARMCPPEGDPVWRQLDPHQDVAVEPEVMGKGSLRVSCRATLRQAQAS